MLILKDKDLLLLETTNSYRRVNLLLSHLLCAICIINSTKGCTPCASYKQMGFLSSKYPINGKHNQHQKKKRKRKKEKIPHNHTVHSWIILGFFSFIIHIINMAPQTLDGHSCYHESNIFSLWNTCGDKGRLFSSTG